MCVDAIVMKCDAHKNISGWNVIECHAHENKVVAVPQRAEQMQWRGQREVVDAAVYDLSKLPLGLNLE